MRGAAVDAVAPYPRGMDRELRAGDERIVGHVDTDRPSVECMQGAFASAFSVATGAVRSILADLATPRVLSPPGL